MAVGWGVAVGLGGTSVAVGSCVAVGLGGTSVAVGSGVAVGAGASVASTTGLASAGATSVGGASVGGAASGDAVGRGVGKASVGAGTSVGGVGTGVSATTATRDGATVAGASVGAATGVRRSMMVLANRPAAAGLARNQMSATHANTVPAANSAKRFVGRKCSVRGRSSAHSRAPHARQDSSGGSRGSRG